MTQPRTLLVAFAFALAACGDDGKGTPAPACSGNIVDRSSAVTPIHDPAIAKLLAARVHF